MTLIFVSQYNVLIVLARTYWTRIATEAEMDPKQQEIKKDKVDPRNQTERMLSFTSGKDQYLVLEPIKRQEPTKKKNSEKWKQIRTVSLIVRSE